MKSEWFYVLFNERILSGSKMCADLLTSLTYSTLHTSVEMRDWLWFCPTLGCETIFFFFKSSESQSYVSLSGSVQTDWIVHRTGPTHCGLCGRKKSLVLWKKPKKRQLRISAWGWCSAPSTQINPAKFPDTLTAACAWHATETARPGR